MKPIIGSTFTPSNNNVTHPIFAQKKEKEKKEYDSHTTLL